MKIQFGLIPAALILLAAQSLFSFQAVRARESEVEKLLTQGDSYSQKGDFKLAIGCYLEASALSQSRVNLSRAYFGLALSYFYLENEESSAKFIRRVLDVDPQKEISELFYPKAFVESFRQAQKEKGITRKAADEGAAARAAAAKTEAENKADRERKQKEEEDKKAAAGRGEKKGDEAAALAAQKPKEEAKKEVPPPPKPKVAPANVAAQPLEQDEVFEEERGGHWEIGAHYSTWSFDLIKPLFEGSLKQKLGEEIQNEVVKKSGTIQSSLVKLAYTQNLTLESQGSNEGIEVRYFTRGKAGTFSLGFALERTNIKLSLKGTALQTFTNGSQASVGTNAILEAHPLSTNVNFRWEFGSSIRLRPYVVFGLGFAPLAGTFTYGYTGTYTAANQSQAISENKVKDFVELSSDIDFHIPDLLVVVQLNFGLKAQLYRGLYLLGEAGVWDGFILRGGLAFRF